MRIGLPISPEGLSRAAALATAPMTPTTQTTTITNVTIIGKLLERAAFGLFLWPLLALGSLHRTRDQRGETRVSAEISFR
jgi:hypothetical protein